MKSASAMKASVRRALTCVLCGMVCMGAVPAIGSTYYLSPRGNDGADGRSQEHPWKTIARLNQAHLAPGDIVCFLSGASFQGTVRAQASGITYTTYGGNVHAVIDGAVRTGRWSLYRGRIYKTHVEEEVKNLFAGGRAMTLARYPNEGFLIVTSTNGTTELTAAGLAQAPGSMKGSQIRIRTTNYTYETRPVRVLESGRLVLEPHANEYPKNFSYGIKQGYGFYLDNALEALDQPGEWYYDRQTHTLYFYAPQGADPSSMIVEASVHPYGIVSRKSRLVIRSLDFRRQAESGLKFEGTTSGTSIVQVSVEDALMHGIEIAGESSSYRIEGCRIDRIAGRGILLERSSMTVIADTRIGNIGLVPGCGIDNEHGMVGIALLAGSGTVIRNCRVDSTGYTGMRTDGAHHRVEGCTITNVMLKLSDGGALYAYNENGQTYGTIWKNNVIRNAVGNIEGTPAVEPEAHGLYWDFRCRDMTAEGNTVEHTASSGLFMQYACHHNTIRGNTFYKCTGNPIHIYTDAKYAYGGNRVTRNILYAEGKPASLYLQFADARVLDIGVIDSNYYSSGAKNPAVRRVYKDGEWKSQEYTLAEWKAAYRQDRHSQEIFRQPASFFARFKRN